MFQYLEGIHDNNFTNLKQSRLYCSSSTHNENGDGSIREIAVCDKSLVENVFGFLSLGKI